MLDRNKWYRAATGPSYEAYVGFSSFAPYSIHERSTANLGPGSPIFANTGAPTLRQPDRSPDGKYFRQAIDPQPQRLIWSFRPSSSLRLSSLYYDSAIVGGGVDNSWLRPSCNQRNHGECDHKFFLLHQSFTENRPFSTHCGRLVCARALSLFRDVIPIRRCHKMTSPPRELDAM